ncbi:hypothetical protein [Lusitaniella coriacea]|uniref:hypothetical protein n=1 Tax=Lusitaniella coriacea TaxID=1983105 RepID=UPI003CEE6C87
MSESVANQQEIQPPLAESTPIKPWSVENDADHLMNDLFLDIDRLLDVGSELPNEPVQTESRERKALVIPSLRLSSAEPLALQSEAPPLSPLQTHQPKSLPEKKPAPQKSPVVRHLDKILFGVACVSLTGVLFWLLQTDKLHLPKFLSPNAVKNSLTQNPAAPLSESDAQFVSYMLRSLDLLDSKAETSQGNNGNNGQSNLPPAPGAGNGNSVSIPQVIERVYIPVYPPTQMPSGSLLPPPPSPRPPSPQAPAKNNPQAAAPAPKPATAKPSTPPSNTDSPPQAAAPAPVPEVSRHTLMGVVVESNGRSAAWFKIDGATQRFQSGQAIGDSGWILVSAANQNAIIRRNGKVRSIYVGQKF